MLWLERSRQGMNAMGKLVADIIVETLQNAGVKHCYGVVGDTLNLIARSLVMPPFMQVEPAIGMALYSTRAILHGRGGDVWEMVRENFL